MPRALCSSAADARQPCHAAQRRAALWLMGSSTCLLGSHQPCYARLRPVQRVWKHWDTLFHEHRSQSRKAQSTDLWNLWVQEFRKIFQPYSCDLHKMNATHFSKCLTGQRLIIIGDSTMRQVFQSLACLLSDHVTDGYLVVSPPSSTLCSISHGA